MKLFNRSILVATVSLLVGFQSIAIAGDDTSGDGYSNWQEHTPSVKTRAQVIAELQQARARGEIYEGGDSNYPPEPAFQTTRSRAQVRHEADKATHSRERFTSHNYDDYSS